MNCPYCDREYPNAMALVIHAGASCDYMPLDRQWFKDEPLLAPYRDDK